MENNFEDEKSLPRENDKPLNCAIGICDQCSAPMVSHQCPHCGNIMSCGD